MNAEILSELVITKVRSVSTMYSPENKRAKRTDRSRWAMIIKYEGETVYTSCGSRFLSDLNHLVLLPKGCSYEWQCTKAGYFCSVEFDSDLTYTHPLVFSLKNGKRILNMIKELEYKRNIKKPTTELESIKDVYSIILTLIQSEPERYLPTEKQKKIAPAIEYISQNYNKSITNDELAERTGLSTVYFRKLFTETVGISPIAYAHELRIQKAKEMLRSDHGSLSDIAHSLGYASLFDFSRDFKKHCGIPPSKYQEGAENI
ncbi:MAG: helix-turn-helix transcriptional regulator [Clostridia bacterium]|nr:helix-turn-helix transcriptional regulator [Clostridia bacterium]